MKLAEFKAWFEGFTESIETAPSTKQWDRIKEQVAKIDGTPVTREVFVDRYVPGHWRSYWDRGWHGEPLKAYSTSHLQQQAANSFSKADYAAQTPSNQTVEVGRTPTAPDRSFDIISAMRDLGRTEAQSYADAGEGWR